MTYDGIDFYCDVALKHPDRLDIVYDDDLVLGFHHTRPFWAVHIVVVPRRHIRSLTSVTADDASDLHALFAAVRSVAALVEDQHGAAAVLTNVGGYQDSKHLHVHIHSGGRLH